MGEKTVLSSLFIHTLHLKIFFLVFVFCLFIFMFYIGFFIYSSKDKTMREDKQYI